MGGEQGLVARSLCARIAHRRPRRQPCHCHTSAIVCVLRLSFPATQELNMGLMDVLNGMQNGPRGARHNTGGTSGGGMSPLTMALLGLLAFKAIKHFTGGQP